MRIEFPQRIAATPRPGALLKRADDLRIVAAREAADESYLAQVRQCPCVKCGMDPSGEAAHVRSQSAAHGKRGGIGKRPADEWALSLCGSCHREDADALHRVGERVFFYRLGINPFLLCERLYARRGDLVAMRAVIFHAISERERR